MYNLANVAANSIYLIEIQLHWEILWHLIQNRPLASHGLHLYLRRLLIFDEVSLLTFKKVIVKFVDQRIFDAIYVGFIYAEIDPIQDFVNDVLVLWVFKPHEFLPVFGSIFFRCRLPDAYLESKWAVFLHLVYAFGILFLLVQLHFFQVISVQICFELITKCVSKQILVLAVNFQVFI